MLAIKNLSLPRTNKYKSIIQQVFEQCKIITARKILKTLQNYSEINERTSQRTHVQNYAYANKSRRTYVRDLHQLSNPGSFIH